jgi:hypothetical protein
MQTGADAALSSSLAQNFVHGVASGGGSVPGRLRDAFCPRPESCAWTAGMTTKAGADATIATSTSRNGTVLARIAF